VWHRHRLVTPGETCTGLVVSFSKPSEEFSGFGLKTIGGRFDGLGLKTIGAGFDRFGPQNRGVADRRTHGGISKLASRRSDVEKTPDPLD
jgi:hypothetical protein